MARTKDLRPQEFPTLSWDESKVVMSLESLSQYVTGEADSAIGWYGQKRGPKRLGGWLLRAGAIIATSTAAAIPVLAESFPTADGKMWIPPGLASIAVIVAVTLIALDRFWGATSGWVRFMLAEQEIGQALETFRFDWEIAKLGWVKPKPTIEQITAAVNRSQTFLAQVHTVVRQETNAWANEFQSVLKQIDDAAKTAAQVKQPGAITVKVTNGDQCAAPPGWMLTVDTGTGRTYTGKEVALGDIAPGIHTVRVTGKINNQDKRAEAAVPVSANAIASVELTLA